MLPHCQPVGAGCTLIRDSEPLPQRTMRKSRRLRGQEPLSPSSPDRVVGSATTPPFGGTSYSPCQRLCAHKNACIHDLARLGVLSTLPRWIRAQPTISHSTICPVSKRLRVQVPQILTMHFSHPTWHGIGSDNCG